MTPDSKLATEKTTQASPAVDPRERFAKPPFPRQKQQRAPGSSRDLTPPAEYGEASYTGHGRLQGRAPPSSPAATAALAEPLLSAMPRKAQTSSSPTSRKRKLTRKTP
jgi:hypothetical protein